MWIADRNREQFLELLRAERQCADVGAIEHLSNAAGKLRRGTVRLVWERRPRNGISPALLVTPAADAGEFFAWTNTYLSGWRPITSFFRVVAEEDLQEMLEVKSNCESVWEYRNAVIGVMFIEAGVHRLPMSSNGEGWSSATGACAATCSFAMGRAMRLGWRSLEAVAGNWHRSQALSRGRVFSRDTRELLGPWSVLAEIGGLATKAQCGTRSVSEAVVAICRGLHVRGDVDAAALAVLTKEWPELEDAFRKMGETRERRVEALEVAVGSLGQRRRRSQQTAAIGLGLLASRIAPGTLDHAALLDVHADRIGGLTLWYGLFSGVTGGARMVDHYEGLGRRILRDMLVDDTVFSSPSCDIAVDELEVISKSMRSLQGMQRASSEQLVVEIFPCVNTVTPWGVGARRGTVRQGNLFDDEAKALRTDVRELNYAAERLLKRLRRFS